MSVGHGSILVKHTYNDGGNLSHHTLPCRLAETAITCVSYCVCRSTSNDSILQAPTPNTMGPHQRGQADATA